ncbi:Bax inhibitor-1/YccA family protein [Mesorhizobium sp. BR1-1-16]|uniref:Bax inhibitor-1/YccA family protein n=1 Tax=Mesorhizobium sp. BR1-1-16 TaxID=2876653 RepID=UPI001CC9AF85|nr:Bax inhibitor-1/YccA family protein [Mesorhizobium sp. BR1-1-16]MBZ9939364.1 Bax inhibitor-1/YccA family protein [Mesorhizobium sp. BR1-1-16]
MADFDNRVSPFGAARAETGVIDQGLRTHMLQVYNYMAIGLMITGAAAIGLFRLATTTDASQAAATLANGVMLTSLGTTVFTGPLMWVLVLAPVALVFVLSFGIQRMSVGTAQITFWAYSALMGLSLASIFVVYTSESIARVFFISAATFGAMSLYGYTTKRDLTGMGSFLFMGLIGIVIASIVNIFIGSSALGFAISILGVLIFVGLTAYDTQKIKEMYSANDDGTVTGRKAIMGALTLYLDFINLFLMLLRLFGDRR